MGDTELYLCFQCLKDAPFSIKSVLSNILVVSDIYKPIINEALNGIKAAKVKGLQRTAAKIDNQELYELWRQCLSMSTGL